MTAQIYWLEIERTALPATASGALVRAGVSLQRGAATVTPHTARVYWLEIEPREPGSASAPTRTLEAQAGLIPGAASADGQTSATAPAATLFAAAELLPGAASAPILSPTVPGIVRTVTSSLLTGSANNGNASVPGQILTLQSYCLFGLAGNGEPREREFAVSAQVRELPVEAVIRWVGVDAVTRLYAIDEARRDYQVQADSRAFEAPLDRRISAIAA